MADSDDQTTPSEATPTEGKKPKTPKAGAPQGSSSARTGEAPPEPVAAPASGEETSAPAAPPAGEAAAPAAAPAPAAPKAKKTKSKKEEAPAEAPKVENLSLDPNDVEKPKIIKAKGSKNVHSAWPGGPQVSILIHLQSIRQPRQFVADHRGEIGEHLSLADPPVTQYWVGHHDRPLRIALCHI